MIAVAQIVDWMNSQAPLALSESWDNTGLLLGDRSCEVKRVQTCLTLTPPSVQEAIDRQADLVISHHPMPFKPLAKITTDDPTGNLLWKLASHRISVYSPHTAWDSAELGINAMIAQRLSLKNCRPLVPSNIAGLENLGAGRYGELEQPLTIPIFCKLLRTVLPNCRLRGVEQGKPFSRVAIACGSGASLLSTAVRAGCDLFLTGEATFHNCLEAQAAGLSMVLVGHFSSEQFAMVELARRISQHFSELDCWASELESDPVKDFHMY